MNKMEKKKTKKLVLFLDDIIKLNNKIKIFLTRKKFY